MLKCSIWWCGKVFSVRPAKTAPPNPINRALKLNFQHQHQSIPLFTCRSNRSVSAMEEAAASTIGFLSKKLYDPPSWASHLNPIPSHTFSLGHLPTPIHKWNLPNLPQNTEVWLKDLKTGRKIGAGVQRGGLYYLTSGDTQPVALQSSESLYQQHCLLGHPSLQNLKRLVPLCSSLVKSRDDLSGMELSGNKVRKLEFLLAEAVAQGADCIITIGGIQSNHCRATAVAAKYLDLDCYLILRTSKVLVDKDPGLTGNLLVERLVGAHIDLVSKEEYAKTGSLALTNLLKEKLISEGRKPYVIPVGGSNSLGTWGYIEAVREIEQQLQTGNGKAGFDDIVVACGSGATVAGLALGSWLSQLKAKVHAFAVCDDPEYFYEYVQGLIDGLQGGVSSRGIVDIKNAKGIGYAMSTPEELKFVKEVAQATGVVLDPVYSGKAAHGMMKDMADNPMKWAGRKILFIHTGGLLGLFDKTDEMVSLVGNWREMDVPESTPRKDGSGKMF